MTLILNILWFIFGGFLAGMAWLLAGLLLAVTIVGLPWAGAAFRIAGFSFAPFGRQVVFRQELTGYDDTGTGTLGTVLNIIWIILGGWYIALAHLMVGIGLCCTLIGIPFGIQHFKLAIIAFAPIGREVVPI